MTCLPFSRLRLPTGHVKINAVDALYLIDDPRRYRARHSG